MTDNTNISWFSDPRQWFRAILMLDDSSHRIALGAAIGMFVALTPTVGIQMVLVLALAVIFRPLFRFNKMAALLAVYVSNPLTVVPIYWFGYKLGTIYFPGDISRQEFEAIFAYQGLSEWWASFTRLFVDVGVPLLAGCFVMATCAGLATYPILLRILRNLRRAERQAMRAKKLAKRREKEERKAAAQSGELASSESSSVAHSTESEAESDDRSVNHSNIGAESKAAV